MKRAPMAAIILMVTASLFLVPVFSGTSAGGTTGTISQSVLSATEGQNFMVQLTALTVSADYSIEVDDVAKFNWTCSATETTRNVRIVIPSAGADGLVKVELADAGVTVIDTLYLQVTTPDSLIPTSLIQTVFIAMIGLFIFAAILVGIKSGMLKRK